MIVTYRLVLVATLQDFIAERRQQLATLTSLIRPEDDPLEASLYIAECRAQAEFIRKLQDLLEEQQATIRRAASQRQA